MRVLLTAANKGQNVLFCMPKRTRCILLVPSGHAEGCACGCAMQFSVYLSFQALALHALWREPWFSDTTFFWRGYPNQPIS
jgi:hypothetical protein